MYTFSFKKIAIISLVCHIVASIFSNGFHHFDEHFQIYEFLNYKLGHITSQDLPWEFASRIRPWFQVFIYYWPAKLLEQVGGHSPFFLAFVFRFFTSLFGWFALLSTLPIIKIWFKDEKWQKFTWAVLHLTWFVPYIQVRTNSESFASSFFILGFVLFLKTPKKNSSLWISLLAGLCLGASYASRYQVAIMVMFLWLWAVVFQQVKLKNLMATALGILILIFSGVLIDYWGYGAWTFGPWNLFYMDIVKGVLESTGESPWWDYFRTSFLRGIPLVSLPLILGTLFFWLKKWRHPLTWATLPFFIFHCLVGHKELRYIFPLILLTPLMSSLALYSFKSSRPYLSFTNFTTLQKISIGSVVVINFILLIFSILRSANPAVNFYNFVWKQNIQEIHLVNGSENPFKMVGLPLTYYKPISLSIINSAHNESMTIEENRRFIFVDRGFKLLAFKNVKNCKVIYATYPLWTLNYNIGNWIGRSRVWGLFECHRP